MELERISIESLFDLVQSSSMAYKTSFAFQESLRYIAKVDESRAKQLLYMEACDMWCKKDVDEHLLKEEQ